MVAAGGSRSRSGKGILVHIFRKGTSNIKLWVENEAELEALELEVQLIDDLRLFWRSDVSLRMWRISDNADLRDGDVFIVIAERLVERRSLVIFGAGHVGYSVARIGVIIGLDVVLVDDREDFLDKARISNPGVRT